MKLVTAIMPTRGRCGLARQAVDCFLAQTYERRELIVVDDVDDRSFPEGINSPRVWYCLNRTRLSIPEKRNQAVGLAQGECILHFDSDDWSSPNRIAEQVKRLEESGKQVVGFHAIMFRAESGWWKYSTVAPYALGTSLCYTREWALAHPFDERLIIGEDNQFVTQAKLANELASVEAGNLMFARIHPGNTSPKKLDGGQCQYRAVPIDAVPKEFLL